MDNAEQEKRVAIVVTTAGLLCARYTGPDSEMEWQVKKGGLLEITRRDEAIALFPKGEWKRVEVLEFGHD